MKFSFTPGRDWYPLATRRHYRRPEAGQLIAYKHAVWSVVRTEDALLSDADRQVWLNSGAPDLNDWRDAPYRLVLDWVGGAAPPWAEKGDERKRGTLTIPAGAFRSWHVYPDGRWPQCSCCGEPMPCRAELEDQQVTASLNQIAKLEAIPPGACWACSEPITTRQKSVAYPGENLDLPGGQQPYFHTRGECRPSAHEYEERWLAADPRRERILTWPNCDGHLIVHADGSSECVSGPAPLGGKQQAPQPDCRGHLTHDHGYHRACYVDFDCTRGCKREDHHGTRTSPRPERRQSSVGGLFQ